MTLSHESDAKGIALPKRFARNLQRQFIREI
jgi:hypothetical protein